MKKRSEWVSSTPPTTNKEPLPSFDKIRRRMNSDKLRRRMNSHGSHRRRTKRRSAFGHREHNHDLVIKWSISLGGIALAVIVSVFLFWLKENKHSTSNGRKLEIIENTPFKRITNPTAEEAVNIVKAAIEVTDPKLVGDYFRLGSSSPQEVIAYLDATNHNADEPADVTWLGNIEIGNLQLVKVGVALLQDGKISSSLAFLIPDEQENWKVDFASYARLTTPSWQEILGEKQVSGTVRVMIQPNYYYNGPFSDDQWICVRMASPDLEQWLFGYCHSNSAQAKALQKILRTNRAADMTQSGMRVTLEIKRPDRADKNQFEITRVLADDWVLQELPFDENL